MRPSPAKMSFTNPSGTTWLLNPSTDSPYSHSDLTDWLHLSPCTSSSLQDISYSSRFNTTPDSDLHNYAIGSQATPGEIIQDHPSLHFRSPAPPQVMTGEPNATLPVLCYTPSPTFVGLDLLETRGDADPRLDPLSMPLTSSPFGYSPFSSSQERYGIKASPLAALFYVREPLGIFESDESPVIRGSQEQVPIYKPKERRRTNRKKLNIALQKQSRSLMFEDLPSTSQATHSSSSSGSSSHMLLSPCKVSVKSPNKDDQGCLITNVPSEGNLAPSSLPSISLRTLSGPDSPLILRIPKLSKRRRDDNLVSMSPHKRLHMDTGLPSVVDEPRGSASSETSALTGVSKLVTLANRNFPTSVEISTSFPLFYRRFPASSYFSSLGNNSPCTLFGVPHPGGIYNPPRSALDLYTPRFVKGRGIDKMGLCPVCIEPLERGGQQKKVWLAMKVSAFKYYHMQYFHGISAGSGRPFSPPLAFRTVERKGAAKTERKEIQQGKCHKCSKWVSIEGIKEVECKVKEIYWWKHAASCHNQTSIPGESGLYEEDAVYNRLLQL